MPRLGLGLGLNLPKPVYLGGISAPSGFVGQYLSYYFADFNLVTGDNVETWSDRSTNNNDLTQTTSANQPLLIKTNVVKQSTLASQPTLVDTGGGVLAVDFAVNDYMLGLPVQSNDFTYVIKTETNTDSELLNLNGVSGGLDRLSVVNTQMYVKSSTSGTFFDFPSSILGNKVYVIKKEGSLLRAYVDGVESTTGAVNIGTETFTVESLSSINYPAGSLSYIKIYSKAVADVTNIVETPDFELLPQTQYLRNSAGLEASAGDSISVWQSTAFSQFDNVVRADATNDLMVGLPTHNALVFRKAVNTLGTQKVLFSSSTTSAQIRTNASNQIEVVSDLGTVFTFATSTVLTTQQTTILQVNGTNLELYESPTLLEAKDFTGETLTIDRALGPASDADWQEIWPYPNALDETSRNYFYYLRNDQNEILLPPLLPS